MDPTTLARLQFGVVASFHFLFVALTMGLVVLIAIMETIAVLRDRPVYRRMARFWGRILLVNVVLGVVTGLVLEFQFGMNWSLFSEAAGDVVGLPLAIEALAAFFVESISLALWYFGHERISPRLRLAAIWGVVVGAYMSAFWVLAANSWMHHPVGYAVTEGKIQLTSFASLFTNPHLWRQFPHTIMATLVTGAFVVMGASAWHLLRGQHTEVMGRSFKLALVVAIVATPMVAVLGHEQAQYKAQVQPMKVAAMEALWESEDPASFSLFANIDEEARTNSHEIELPYLLSILAYNRPTGEVKGLNQLEAEYDETYGEGDYTPPVEMVYWSFRVMVGLGLLFILVSLLGGWLWYQGRLLESRRFLWATIALIPAPYVANTAGWIVAEVGRQPWIIQGVLTTQEAASPSVGTGMLIVSLVLFLVVYLALTTLDYVLIARIVREGPEPLEEPADGQPLNPGEVEAPGA